MPEIESSPFKRARRSIVRPPAIFRNPPQVHSSRSAITPLGNVVNPSILLFMPPAQSYDPLQLSINSSTRSKRSPGGLTNASNDSCDQSAGMMKSKKWSID